MLHSYITGHTAKTSENKCANDCRKGNLLQITIVSRLSPHSEGSNNDANSDPYIKVTQSPGIFSG